MKVQRVSKAKQDAIQECLTLGHFTEEYHESKWQSWGDFTIHIRCVRCGWKKHETWGYCGEVMSRTYERPPGYKQERSKRLTRDNQRVIFARNRGVRLQTKGRRPTVRRHLRSVA